MNYFVSYLILFFLYFFFKIIFQNFKSQFYFKHQKFAGQESIPFLGGIIMFCFYSYEISIHDLIILFFSFFILLLGVFSDCNFIQSPKIRLILQSSVLLFFVYLSEIQINDLRNEFLNNLISNYYFGLFFTTFCFLVLINGSNFIDGLDGLNLGYFFLITITLIYLYKFQFIKTDINQLKVIFYVISFLLVFNIFNYLYLGDSGSYLIGFIFGMFLIEWNNVNYFVSPYFIALLLWYPAFENLFSIIRKRILKLNPLKPDNLHLHQLLFRNIRRCNNQKVKRFSNIISSFIINIYNLVIFVIGVNYFNNSKILLFLLLINVIFYFISYFSLNRYKL